MKLKLDIFTLRLRVVKIGSAITLTYTYWYIGYVKKKVNISRLTVLYNFPFILLYEWLKIENKREVKK